jgi:hypothetical protein
METAHQKIEATATELMTEVGLSSSFFAVLWQIF